MTTKQLGESVVKYIALHMRQGSAFLSSFPETYMADPYGLLGLLQDKLRLSNETIDDWMVEAQAKKEK